MKKFLILLTVFCTVISSLPVSAASASYNIKKAEATLSYSVYSYTGSPIKPKMTVKYGGKVLSKSTDYSVSYKNNTEWGTAVIKITGKGRYTGTLEKKFMIRIKSVSDFKASSSAAASLKLTWKPVKCDEYYIYRYDSAAGGYKLLAKTAGASYTDKDLIQLKRYYYQIKAVRHTEDGKNYYSKIKKANCRTGLSAPVSFKIAAQNGAVTASWKENTRADGYQLYRCDGYPDSGSAFKRIKTLKGSSAVSYKNTGIDNDSSYFYKARAYKTISGTTYYSKYTSVKCSSDNQSKLNCADLKSHKTFPVYNAQGKTTVKSYSVTLSDADINTLKRFAADHFESGMTREDKLYTVLIWINEEVKYARGADWDTVESKSFVDAVFNYKLGQCAQYNGAMASMMAYLGYDVKLIQGYRGSWDSDYWQHFWTEVSLGGITYIMETGNNGQSGYWYYFLAKYSETRGYIKNQQNM